MRRRSPVERLAHLTAALRTPPGRRRVLGYAAYAVWPVLGRLAGVYRRTLLRRTRVVCVVGSFGKTTTARAVAAALGAPALGGTGNARGQVALALLGTRPWRRHAVLEVAIGRPGDMARHPPALRPDVAVVTGIGTEHSRAFRSLEATRHEKAEMVRALRAGGTAVLNGDDPNVRWMAGKTRARVVTFGFGADVDVRGTDVALDWPRGTRFRLHTRDGVHDVRVRLIGRPGVFAILAAAAVAVAEDRPLDGALRALEALAPTPGRLEPVALPTGAHLLRDDYKSPAETIEAALEVLSEIPAARRLVVLGDVSEPLGPPRAIYERIGARLARVATRAVLVGGSDLRSYRAGARAGGLAPEAIRSVGRSVREAAAAIAADLRPGDVVLIKGRDSQRLDRVALLLQGRVVRCELVECNLPLVRCERCPMLERGPGRPALTE
jgi:UDP-N-acetylmuramoyl-tripeptide--D-alanyl-D-alanine ligase